MRLQFRDEWIENYFPVFDTAASSYKLRMARQLERDAVTCADYVAAVTPSQLQQIRRRYPEPTGVLELLETRFGFRRDVPAARFRGNVHFEEFW